MTRLSAPWPWACAVVAVVAAPWVFDSGLGRSVLVQIGIAAIACLSYNLLWGQGGMLGFGHAIYTGAGAYAAIYLLRGIETQGWVLPVGLLPLLAGGAGLAAAAVTGLLLTRRAGTVFAMITLGLGELVYAAALMFPQWSGGEAGVSGNRVQGVTRLGVDLASTLQLYHLVAAYALACAAAMYLFTTTVLGRLLNAVRDNPERVEFIGFPARWIRYRALLLAGFFAGIAGGLAALLFEIVTPEVFSPLRSGSYLLFTFLGGTAHFLGPVLGAVLMVVSQVLLSAWTPAWMLYLGLVFMVAVVVAPTGLAGLLVAGWQAWRAPPGRLPMAASLGRAACAIAALAGAMALVEMAYHRQLDTVLGARFGFLGLTLDGARPAHWAAAAAWLLAWGGLWWWARRRAQAQAQAQEGTA